MSIARTADRRFFILLTALVLAIIVLSFISFEVVTHFTMLWQVFHGVAYGQDGVMPHHP